MSRANRNAAANCFPDELRSVHPAQRGLAETAPKARDQRRLSKNSATSATTMAAEATNQGNRAKRNASPSEGLGPGVDVSAARAASLSSVSSSSDARFGE